MKNAKQILEALNKLNEQEILMTPELIKQIYDAAYIDYEIEEDEEIRTYEYNTGYNTYKYYEPIYGDKNIMLAGDYELIQSELVENFVQALPDKFDRFFNEDAFLQAVKQDKTWLDQVVYWLNDKEGAGIDYIDNIEEVEVNGINYILFDLK